MVMQVLLNKSQILHARKELNKRKLSFIDSIFVSKLRRVGLVRGVSIGDSIKSWDVLESIKLIEADVEKNCPILDIGCYASEVIVALHSLGYSNLTGVDLNPNLQKMPYANSISYLSGNFLNTQFEDSSFQAITAISVIEHGFDGPGLLKEMSRILKPGGLFIASFDYWPEKIDTTGIKFFDMNWDIFSKQDIVDFICQAASHGLVPVGEMSYESRDKVIHCGGQKYTFGWMAFEKIPCL